MKITMNFSLEADDLGRYTDLQTCAVFTSPLGFPDWS